MRPTLAALAVLVPSAAGQQCGQAADGFHLPGVDGSVYSSVVWDDGTGPALYVGGRFGSVGGVPARSVARWNGTTWSDVGADISGFQGSLGTVHALAAHAGALYAGGVFSSAGGSPASNIARFDGSTWSALPGGGVGGDVYALASFQGQLYVGGFFSTAGGVPATRIARFDGANWSYPTGGPYNGQVYALEVWDDGSGPSLYVGGGFIYLGAIFGTLANSIARYDGSSWSPLGIGMGTPDGTSTGVVGALEVFDSGTGPKLHAAGSFGQAGGGPASNVARWSGTSWSPVGSGVNGTVTELRVHDEGAGPRLFAAGYFTVAGGHAARSVARWNGAAWTALGAGTAAPAAMLESYQGGLVVGGEFLEVAGQTMRGLAQWSNSAWGPVGTGFGLVSPVLSFCAFDSGAGPQLHATVEGGPIASNGPPRVHRWNGSGWTVLGTGPTSGPVEASAVHDDGSGPALYVAGNFTVIGGVGAVGFARWNGSAWSAPAAAPTYQVRRLRVLDLGTGPALYAANTILTLADHGVPTGNYVSRWTGSSWQPLGPAFSNDVEDIAVFDAGSGPALYATGDFQTNGGTQLGFIARWDPVGSSWLPIGGMNSSGASLAVHDDGSGPQLYVGGYFSAAGGVPANRIARWNGFAWSAVGAGLGATNQHVEDMLVHDDGNGPRLFATGNFDLSGSRGLAVWDGAQWSLYQGLTTPATFPSVPQARAGVTLASFDDGLGNGPDLWVGGEVTSLGAEVVANVGRIEGCGALGAPICLGDGSGTACPCGNASPVGANAGCVNSFGAGGRLVAQGVASIGDDTYVLAGSSMPNSTVLYFSGTTAANGGDGVVFGDGLRCAGGVVHRLGTVTNAGGASALPNPASTTALSVRDPVAAGDQRVYQAWYRNAAAFCTSDTFNLTNAWRVNWSL
ncbi:MAG: hypothetical protein NTY35_07685 [Planctomycetota bacterium]|nr:hypothetical protein [Planctomycetota bacterium]